MDHICRDDFIIGYVDDLKRYFRKQINDLTISNQLDEDWLEVLKDYADTLAEIIDLDDEMLVKIEPSLMGGYHVKELKEEE